jgi:hypothetical protein
VVLVAFKDLATRDRWVGQNCDIYGGPLIVPREGAWILASYSATDLPELRSEVDQAGVSLRASPECSVDGLITIPAPTPAS